MKKFLISLVCLSLLVETALAGGYYNSGYYSPSYYTNRYQSYSYPSYSSYAVPYYVKKEIPVYKEYPVARYIDIYPVYGQLYFGPGSAAAYATAVNAATKATQASTQATQASSVANAASSQLTQIQGDVKSVLTGVKDLTTIVAGMQNKVNGLEARMNSFEGRLKSVEVGKPTIDPTKPPVPGPAPKSVPNPTVPDALRVTLAKCAACHQTGKPIKGKLTLLKADGTRAPLTGDQIAAMTTRITEGSMPPPAKAGEPATSLSEAETYALLMDVKSYPRKKEGENEVLYIKLPGKHRSPGSVSFNKFRKRQ